MAIKIVKVEQREMCNSGFNGSREFKKRQKKRNKYKNKQIKQNKKKLK